MDTPLFTDGQFVNATLLAYAIDAAMTNFKIVGTELHTPGLLSPSALVFTPSNLIVQISAPSPFSVVFGSGLVVGAHGTVNGADTSTYNLDLSSFVPGTGSQLVYILAEYSTVSESITTVVGAPPGHPDYDPNFSPFEFYTIQRDTVIFAGSTTAANNTTTFEVARLTLAAGQSIITPGDLTYTGWSYASSVLNPTGVTPGSYTNANITVQADGRISSISAAVTFMVGEVKIWPLATPPTGFLLCDGSAISRTTYANLFALIGTTFGAGDGSTTFNIPDARARTVIGYDAGSATGRVTSAGSGVNPGAVGAAGGHQLVQVHTHTITDPGHIHGVSDPSHAHSVSQTAHVHGVNDPTHAHGISDPGHAHAVSDPGHAHTEYYYNSAFGNSPGPGASGSSGSVYGGLNTTANAANVSIDAAGTGIGVYAAYSGVSVAAAVANVSIVGAYTGIGVASHTTGITGTGASGTGNAQNMQPTLVLNYIIYTG